MNDATIARYNKRLSERGPGAYALGWGRKAFQIKRFRDLLHALESSDIRGKVVLDIGCGIGDLLDFFSRRSLMPRKFVGIDINRAFIDIARKRFSKPSYRSTFAVRDILLKPYLRPVADTGVALGVINFKQREHLAYAKAFMAASFASVRETLIVNVISDVHNDDYPREPFIYYFKPRDLLSIGFSLTPFCSLIQDYAAEPQSEMMLILRKKPWHET